MKFEEYKLGDLIESISVTHKFPEEKIIFLNTSDILEGSILTDEFKDVDSLPGQAKKSITKGDILYSEIRPKNKRYAFIDFDSENYVVSTKLMVLRVKDSRLLNNKYLYYYLTSSKIVNHLQNLAESRSGTFPQITFSEIASLEITLPTLQIQKRVVDFMDNLNDKLEINNTIISNLEELAQTLFKRWFVDFEFPNEEGKPYKLSGGKMVESELGMIPEGWEVEKFEKIINIGSGKRPKSKVDIQDEDNQIPIIGASKVMGYTETELFDESIIVIGRVGTHGVVQRLNIPCWPSDNTFVLRSKYEEFMYHKLKTIDYKSMNRGSTQPLLTQKDIKNVKVILPNNTLLIDFEDTQKKFSSKIGQLKEENTKLEELRDTLLPKLLSGEIKLLDDMEVTDDVPIS